MRPLFPQQQTSLGSVGTSVSATSSLTEAAERQSVLPRLGKEAGKPKNG
jgi:hypothetical protein